MDIWREYDPEKEIELYTSGEGKSPLIRITAERYKIREQICSFYRLYYKGMYLHGTNYIDNIPKMIEKGRQLAKKEKLSEEYIENIKKRCYIEPIKNERF